MAARPNGAGNGPRAAPPPKWTAFLRSLTELGLAKYKGEDGGLYGGGRNEPPPAHFETAMKE
jgi:hypothetical protein